MQTTRYSSALRVGTHAATLAPHVWDSYVDACVPTRTVEELLIVLYRIQLNENKKITFT